MIQKEVRKIQFQDRQDEYWNARKDEFGCINFSGCENSPKPRIGDWWGDWKYTSTLTLELIKDGRWRYEVDLERCKDLEQCAEWIFHMLEKNWITDKDLAQLTRALSDIKDIHR
jgi:hypothetical protein